MSPEAKVDVNFHHAPWPEGRQATQRWAVAYHEREEAQRRVDAAEHAMVQASAETASYVRSDGPVVCKLNGTEEIVMVWWDNADGAIHAKVGKP